MTTEFTLTKICLLFYHIDSKYTHIYSIGNSWVEFINVA